MIERLAKSIIIELAQQFPAIFILGARQSGKTTLAKYFLKGDYFDLERPSDQQVFINNVEFALRRLKRPVIIDEAQILPEIFPVLRALIDEKRNEYGQYYLLGSVNPALMKHISESLAGRVGRVELTPFLYPEISHQNIDLYAYWLKGGFPDALKEKAESRWQRWQENYVQTFIERDIPRQGLKISPIQMRRLMVMLAHQHGNLLNSSELGRSLGLSYHTINDYLDIIEGHYLIRRVPPYHFNIKKRIVKSPKIYIRDTGILHYFLGIANERNLLESPKRGNSFEGLVIEQIVSLEKLNHVGTQFYFYRTYAGAEIDLILDRGNERIGIEIKCSESATPRDWANLKGAIDQKIIDRGYLVNFTRRNYDVTETIRVISIENLLSLSVSGFDGVLPK